MTDVLPSDAPMPRAVLGWDGTRWRVMAVDGSGHVQVDVLGSALPAGAATAANQATMITALQLIDDLVGALGSVNTDDLQVDVKTSALPTGAATAAHQATMITALQLIDDLRNALDSVGTDELDVNVEASVLPTGAATSANQALMIALLEALEALGDASQSVGEGRLVVRGEDQLFSFEDKLFDYKSNTDTAAGDIDLFSSAVPEGKIWVVTSVTALNTVTVCSMIYLYHYVDGTWCAFRRKITPGIVEGVEWTGEIYLEEGDKILGQYGACALHDEIFLEVLGYQMTKEVGAGPGAPPPEFENFLLCAEVDPGSDITVTASKCDVDTMETGLDAWVACDHGADHFGDFEHLITVHCSAADNYAEAGCWGLSNGIYLIEDMRGAHIGMTVYFHVTSGGALWMVLNDDEAGNEDIGYPAYGVTYYLTIERAGTTLTCKVYTDEDRTVLVETLTITCGTRLYRYLEPVFSRGYDGLGRTITYYVENLALQE